MMECRKYASYLLFGALAIFLTSCASSGGSAIKRDVKLRNLGITTQGEDTRIEVVDIIQPGGPSSWVDDARWTEIVVRITNTSKTYLSFRDCQLVSASGALIPVTENPLMLANIQQQVSESMAGAQAVGAATSLGYQAVYSIPGFASAAYGAVPFLGGVLSLVGALAQQQQAAEIRSAANRPQEIMAELEQRAFKRGSGVAPGGHIEGSMFFPYTRAPQNLVLTYEAEGAQEMLEVSLARAAADLNAKVKSAVLKTDQGELPLTTTKEPVDLGSAYELKRIALSFSRPLSSLEVQNLRIGFSEDFPCKKPESVDVTPDKRSIILSDYPDACLREARGFYDLGVTGLNLEPAAFPIQKGMPPGAKRSTAKSSNPFVEVVANQGIIREAPKIGKVLKRVAKGTQLEKLDDRGNWTKVLIGGEQVGWIASGVLRELSLEVTPAKDLTYEFQAGDSLSDIAAKFTGNAENWSRIAEYNGIADPSQLNVGMVIKIPAALVKESAR